MLSERIRDRGTSTCEELADLLPGVVDGTTRLDRADRRHVEHCLRCQAELAQYRKLLRAMRTLRATTAAPPAGLVTGVLARVETVGERSAVRAALTGKRAAYIGGIAAAATAAGAGAVVVIVTRGRKGPKGRLPLAG
ncbi:MAG: hypothetical protein U0P45_16625 [Acidimicrobiales bacterium]